MNLDGLASAMAKIITHNKVLSSGTPRIIIKMSHDNGMWRVPTGEDRNLRVHSYELTLEEVMPLA